jgi:hypothetical protein
MRNDPDPSISANQHRFSRQGFQHLSDDSITSMGAEGPNEIALQSVPTHRSQLDGSGDLEKGSTGKSGLFHRGGKRKLRKVDSRGQPTGPYKEDSDDGVLTIMGKIYTTILNFSIITRYFLYVLPLAAAIAVPIVIGATVAKGATIGGVRIVWFFTWIEVGKKFAGLGNCGLLTDADTYNSVVEFVGD